MHKKSLSLYLFNAHIIEAQEGVPLNHHENNQLDEDKINDVPPLDSAYRLKRLCEQFEATGTDWPTGLDTNHYCPSKPHTIPYYNSKTNGMRDFINVDMSLIDIEDNGNDHVIEELPPLQAANPYRAPHRDYHSEEINEMEEKILLFFNPEEKVSICINPDEEEETI